MCFQTPAQRALFSRLSSVAFRLFPDEIDEWRFADAREEVNYVNNRAAYLYTLARCIGVINRRPRAFREATIINTNRRVIQPARETPQSGRRSERDEKGERENGFEGRLLYVPCSAEKENSTSFEVNLYD